MNKIYYLKTCSTCMRIIKELQINKSEFDFQDIKTHQITEDHLNVLYQMSSSYEKLFNKRSRKFKSLEPSPKDLREVDYKNLILEEYTFLKRPVIIFNNAIYIGNSKKNIENLKNKMTEYHKTY